MCHRECTNGKNDIDYDRYLYSPLLKIYFLNCPSPPHYRFLRKYLSICLCHIMVNNSIFIVLRFHLHEQVVLLFYKHINIPVLCRGQYYLISVLSSFVLIFKHLHRSIVLTLTSLLISTVSKFWHLNKTKLNFIPT